MIHAAVHELVGRIRACVGFDFTLHMLRHTHATSFELGIHPKGRARALRTLDDLDLDLDLDLARLVL